MRLYGVAKSCKSCAQDEKTREGYEVDTPNTKKILFKSAMAFNNGYWALSSASLFQAKKDIV